MKFRTLKGSDHYIGQWPQARAVVQTMAFINLHRWSKEAGVLLGILTLSIITSAFLGRFIYLKGFDEIYNAFLRFLHVALLLCLPMYLLLPIVGKLGRSARKGIFIRMEDKQDLEIHPIKHWLYRPFQGIGIGLLFATKLLGVFQIITGSTPTASFFSPRGQFQPERFLIVTGTTVLVSLLLSVLWTLDDLGIRYFNRKDYEIKMVGNYVGMLMPILFGFYGIFSLFGAFPKIQALIYLSQIVVILYPPFAVFSIIHVHVVQSQAENLLKRLFIIESEIKI